MVVCGHKLHRNIPPQSPLLVHVFAVNSDGISGHMDMNANTRTESRNTVVQQEIKKKLLLPPTLSKNSHPQQIIQLPNEAAKRFGMLFFVVAAAARKRRAK